MTLSLELNDNKRVEVNGKTKSDDDIDIVGTDEKKESVSLFPALALFGLGSSRSHEKTICVDINKRK